MKTLHTKLSMKQPMTTTTKSVCSILLVALSCFAAECAVAACNATVNGRAMTAAECALNIQVYGGVIPGDYAVDASGNWVNVNNFSHRGNIVRDAQSTSQGGSWGGGSVVSPGGVYDASGGCEGGSCVNIIN